jgi:predicted DNA-binding protein
MKTMAIRLEDETADLLSVVAQLEGTSVIDQIRQAIEAHLALKADAGELADRAKAALDDIDREASKRKAAIESMIGKVTPASGTPTKKAGRRAPSASEEPTLGFAPAPTSGSRRRGK